MKKENPNLFPIQLGRCQTWHMSNGTFHMHGRGTLTIIFLDNSTSREYLVQPDIVKYVGTTMIQPEFHFILGANTLKEQGIL